MFASIALSLFARPANITYSCPATRLEEVVRNLAEKSGQKLIITKGLEGKFVAVRFSDVPIEEALDRIAKCYKASWKVSGSTRVLQQDSAVEGSNAAWLEAIEKYLKEGNGEEPFTAADCQNLIQKAMTLTDTMDHNPEAYQKIRELEVKGPHQRLVRRIVNQIGAKTLANLPDNSRSVFSLRPNRLQRQLPASAKAAVDNFVRESAMKNEALASKGITPENRYDTYYYTGILEPREQNQSYSDVMLVAKKRLGSFEINVLLKGKNYTESIQDNINSMREAPVAKEPIKIKVEGDFKPSEKSIVLGKAIKSMNTSADTDTLAPSEQKIVMDQFLDLEKNELLTTAPTEFLEQVADSMKRDFVAALDDISIYLLAFTSAQEKTKLQTILQQASMVWDVQDDGKSLTVSPSKSMPFTNFVIPRKSVSKFVRDVSKAGVTIDALADLALSCPDDESGGFVLMLANLPFPEKKVDMNFMNGSKALRIYGSLDPATRKRAKTEEVKLTYGSLNQFSQKVISNYVFNELESTSGSEFKMDEQNVYANGADIDREPTNLFAGGIPMNSQIIVSLKTLNSLFIVDEYSGGYSSSRTATPEDAARTLAWAEKTRGREGYNQNTKLAKGNMERLDIGIIFQKDSNSHLRYDLQPKFKKKDLLEVSQLPEADRKAIEDLLKVQREQLKDVNIDSGRPPRIKP